MLSITNYLPDLPPKISAIAGSRKNTSSNTVHKVQEICRQTLQLTQEVFAKVWDQALATGRIQWKKPLSLTDVEKALRETLVYQGKGLQIEWKASCNPHIHGLVGYLLGKDTFLKKWLDDRVVKAIFFQKNPEVLRCMREEFANFLEACGQQLPIVGTSEEALFQTLVGNCIALLPYTYPKEGDQFIIPQKIEGEWKACKYTVDPPIQLTPSRPLSPILSFGLISQEGPPLMSIIGTTFPAGDGFLATLLSDATPGMSVGHAAYLMGQKNITAWLSNKSQVRLHGVSLGGALCLHVLRHHKEVIDQVFVYNPAGLYPWNWKESFENQMVNIYYQENDLVATMGSFPTGKGVSVFRVFRSAAENFLKAHTRVYAGGDEILIVKSSPEYENSRPIRQFLTGLHIWAGLTLAIFTVCIVLIATFFANRTKST